MRLPPVLVLPLVPVLLLLLSGCGSDEDESSARAARSAVECELTRLAGGKKASVKVTVPLLEDAESVENSDGLDSFKGSYSFVASAFEGSLEVTFFENKHVQDEVGSLSCGEIPKKKGVFCRDEIFIDKNLGTGSDEDVQVKGFAFACKRL